MVSIIPHRAQTVLESPSPTAFRSKLKTLRFLTTISDRSDMTMMSCAATASEVMTLYRCVYYYYYHYLLKGIVYRNVYLRFVTWSSLIRSDFLADDSCGLGRSKSVLNQSYGLLCNGKVFSACSGDLYNLANTQYSRVNTFVWKQLCTSICNTSM